MVRSQLDHIVVTAPSLFPGVEHVNQALGVTLEVGGEHPRMGTHNYFVKLGERVYLEVIAIDPEAPAPGRPRWYGLDEGESLRLATWVARTNDIEAASLASPEPLGTVEPMSRSNFNWHITIPEDGSLPLDGIAPTLIQWQDAHPADGLQDAGCSLIRLAGFHPEPGKVDAMLTAIGFEGDFSVSPLPRGQRPYLVVHIDTPGGRRELRTA